MRLTKMFMNCLYLIVHKVKGNKRIIPIHTDFATDVNFLELKFYNLNIRVYVKKKQYRRKYDRWYMLGDQISIFHVWSEVIDTSPDVISENKNQIIKACDFKTELPALVPEFLSYKIHRAAIEHAYIDILMHRLTRIKAGLPP